MHLCANRTNQKGFTLLEVIIAGAILAVGMLALIPLLIQSYRVDTETMHKVRAQYLVTQQLDELISKGEDIVCNGVEITDYFDAHSGHRIDSPSSVPVPITRSTIVSAPVGTSRLCQITVTTTYIDNGLTKKYQTISQQETSRI